MSTPPLDILALAAHRDDVEQTCGGTMLKMAQQGYRTGILDLTQGEMGTRGSAEDRAREAQMRRKYFAVSWRQALDIPDGRVENTWENRLKVASVLREQKPKVVILPYWKGRHPDHYTASILGYEACFLAGLAKLDTALAIQDMAQNVSSSGRVLLLRTVRSRSFTPRFITTCDLRSWSTSRNSLKTRLQSLMAYKSQFSDQEAGKGIFPAHAEIRSRVEAMARFYGMLAGVTYAEPFLQKEVGLVEDLTLIPVKSI